MIHETHLTKFKTRTVSALVVLVFCCGTVDAVKADTIEVFIELPGVQSSALAANPVAYGATDVFVEDFDRLSSGPNGGFDFNGNNSIGHYGAAGQIDPANQYGGAGGAGKYLGVKNNTPDVVLALVNPQRYFGFWWSAGDVNNVLQFYDNGSLIASVTTADVVAYTLGNPAYNGNPNSGSNPAQPYAFLNFFADPNDTSVVFDEIHFKNSAGAINSTFESDNHTVASSYTNTSGDPIPPGVPEPTAAALLGLAGLGMCFRRRRR